VSALPVILSRVQATPSLHSVGQSPSQVSLASTTPLPHEAEQSPSVVLLQPEAQQPSPARHSVTGWKEQATLQLSGLPVMVSMVHALPSLHSVGQVPSQVSPSCTTPSPQKPEQSESLAELQPAGQQPSPC